MMILLGVQCLLEMTDFLLQEQLPEVTQQVQATQMIGKLLEAISKLRGRHDQLVMTLIVEIIDL